MPTRLERLLALFDGSQAEIVARYEADCRAARQRAEADLRMHRATRRQVLLLVAGALGGAAITAGTAEKTQG